MDAEPVKEAADPAREAEKAPPTVLHGTLTVEVPGGETMVLKTTFDSGSNTDAVSEKVAIQLKKLGVPWGEAGGGVSMAVSSSVAVPHGELRLLLSAEPSGSDGRADELAIPRPLQFVTDALIMKDLSNDLIIGWPTLKGTGLCQNHQELSQHSCWTYGQKPDLEQIAKGSTRRKAQRGRLSNQTASVLVRENMQLLSETETQKEATSSRKNIAHDKSTNGRSLT